jgi:hypothetical protein
MGGFDQQWSAVQSAPGLYIAALIAVGLATWAAIHFLYKHRMEGLREELAKEERENRRLKQKLDEVVVSTLPSKPARAKSRPTPRSEVKAMPADAVDRVMVPEGVQAETLRAFFKGKTALEGKRLLEPYLGKWMRVSGVVRDVENNDTLGWTVSIDDDPEALLALITLYLLDGEGPKAEMLRRDAMVSALGRIEKADQYLVSLADCVLQ